MTEQWRPVVGYEGLYEVSDQGRVRSLDRNKAPGKRAFKGRVLVQSTTRDGYKCVSLSKGGKIKTVRVHWLVLEAFDCPRPEGKEACHNNGEPSDNRLENLRWGTRSENMMDKVRHGNHHNAKKTECSRGHAFTPENTYWDKSGGRDCRTCRNIRLAKYRKENRPGVR